MKIILVSDAWLPQINGVVRTWQMVISIARDLGHEVEVIHPALFRSIPCPTYPDIRLAVNLGALSAKLKAADPDAIHIATEGPLGFAARQYCLRQRRAFTTSFHTKFPEYIEARFGLPARHAYRYLRWFHAPAAHVLVATPSLRSDLAEKGFQNTVLWTRGVDISLFNPEKRLKLPYDSPILLYVGRIAVEKNIEAFLNLPLLGTKLLVGDGPQRAALEKAYPQAVFLGMREGEALAELYASADVFVFPSKTDTFGLVMLEALASGTPVAAYPVTGPRDVLQDASCARMHDDLQTAVIEALSLKRSACRDYAQHFTWQRCAELWLHHLQA